VALIEAIGRGELAFTRQKSDGPNPNAYVSLEGSWGASISVSLPDLPRSHATYKPRGQKAGWSDLHWKRTFSHRTLSAIASILALEDVQTTKTKKEKVA
jgi:hypothetical protein